MLPTQRLDKILAHAEKLQEEMNGELPPDRFVTLSKEYAALAPLVEAVSAYRGVMNEIEDLQSLISGDDGEMKALAEIELPDLQKRLPEMEQELQILLLPKDAADEMNVILEVRAGTGGDEAALFAGDLLRMYLRYAELEGYKTELISQSEGDVGG